MPKKSQINESSDLLVLLPDITNLCTSMRIGAQKPQSSTRTLFFVSSFFRTTNLCCVSCSSVRLVLDASFVRLCSIQDACYCFSDFNLGLRWRWQPCIEVQMLKRTMCVARNEESRQLVTSQSIEMIIGNQSKFEALSQSLINFKEQENALYFS